MWQTRKRIREHREELAVLLEMTKRKIDQSEESFWSGLSPADISMDMAIAIESLRDSKQVDRDQLKMHFAPTGPLQETAMASDWTNEYVEISTRFDGLIDRI